MRTSGQALLLEDVSIAYGKVSAIADLSLAVGVGETVALLGPNGAGKSTLLRGISNQVSKVSGTVRFGDTDITHLPAHRITRVGVVHVPEGRRMVGPLTVNESLKLAARASRRCPPKEVEAGIAEVYELFPALTRMTERPTALLSGGEQQMVAIGRALMARPEVLLLDEPSMGLAPVMIEVIYDFLRSRPALLDGVAILLAEQSRIALDVADRVAVLSRGRLLADASVEDLSDDVLKEAYLGASAG